MAGCPNFLGHTFVLESDLESEDKLKANLISFMKSEKNPFKRIAVYETLADKETITLNEAKALLKQGIE